MDAIIITLTPQDNSRLQSLCGSVDQHITLIENSFGLSIARNGFTFTIAATDNRHCPPHLMQHTAQLLRQLYQQTAPLKGKIPLLDLPDIHLAIQESRMLLQQSNSYPQHDIVIKTKRGVIKPRGEHQNAYLHNILHHDISFGIGPAGTGKTFLAVAAAIDALEKQEIRRILLTRPARKIRFSSG